MKLLILSILVIFSTLSFARDGSSGCGPGWYVLKDNSLLSSSLRFTTNGLLVPSVTLGMTFGTSNCTKHSIVKLEKERTKFVTENYFELASDIAKGKGEYLLAYGELLGCKRSGLESLSKKLQGKFSSLFSFEKVDANRVVKKTYRVILSDEKLVNSCLSA